MRFVYERETDTLSSENGRIFLIDDDKDILGFPLVEDGDELDIEIEERNDDHGTRWLYVSEDGHGEISVIKPRFVDPSTAYDYGKYGWVYLNPKDMELLGLGEMECGLYNIKIIINGN